MRSDRWLGRGIAAVGLALLPSCVGYLRFRENEPLERERIEALRPGVDDLGQCLSQLGAPVHVFEYRIDGMVLLWTWQDTDDWSLDVSLPVTDFANAEFELDLTASERPGCALWFGPDLILERVRQGRIGDLLDPRARPRFVDVDA